MECCNPITWLEIEHIFADGVNNSGNIVSLIVSFGVAAIL